MKQFLLKLILFCLVIFIVDKSFIIIRNYAPKFNFDRRLEMVLEGKINKDIIVMGSSRGESNVDVKLIQDSLNINNVFNLSYGGASPEFQEFVFDKLIENNKKPKLIIKLIDDDFEIEGEDNQGNEKGFRFDRLYPLVKYREIREELISQGDKNRILSELFILYQLNRSNFDFRTKGVIDTIYGARPRKGSDSSLDWVYKNQPNYERSKEDELHIESLIRFQEKCQKNNIKLIFATAPVFRQTNEEWIKRMKELTLPSTVFFEHDLKNVSFKEKEFFLDFSHLNNKGSEIYTNDLVSFIKKTIK